MRVLLDTNIVIHREASHVVNEDIGTLFRWLDRLHYEKCVHPLTLEEIGRHADKRIVESMQIKLDTYHILKTTAPLNTAIATIIHSTDKTDNDINDSKILNELICERVDWFVTEDRAIHEKAEMLGVSERVFTIDEFLEMVAAENPGFVDYKVLSVKKEYIGNVNLADSFFDSFKQDYVAFERWFNKKADEIAYVCKSAENVIAFLYLKLEDGSEDYSDITPMFRRQRRLKIGTFKVAQNAFRLGERLLKIVFDNALALDVTEIYVTIFPKRVEQVQLIGLLKDWGFRKHGIKESLSGIEDVYARDFRPAVDPTHPQLTYPFISGKARKFLVPIYPEYHTELLPDSILRTESPVEFVENEPHRNSIKKVYISRSVERDLDAGDITVFYRTGGYHVSVVSTIGVVENIITSIKDGSHFVKLCRKRSVFSDEELIKHWNYRPNSRPFIVNFLYVYSFKKRPNLKRLIEVGVIRDIQSAPRGFMRITNEQFQQILIEACFDESLIID